MPFFVISILNRNKARESYQIEQHLNKLQNEKRVFEERTNKLVSELNKDIGKKNELVAEYEAKLMQLECEHLNIELILYRYSRNLIQDICFS